MPRKTKTAYKPPYFFLDVRSHGHALLQVTSTGEVTPAPYQKEFGASIRVTEGVDRLAMATTLVEVARDLVDAGTGIQDVLAAAAMAMVKLQMQSGDRYVVKTPDDMPF